MTLHRRTFLHGLLALPAGGTLARFPRPILAVPVRTGDELRTALGAVAPCGTVTLAPGDFGDVSLFELATPGVTLRAEVPGTAVLRAPLLIREAAARARVLDLAYHGEGEANLYLSAAVSCAAAHEIRAADVEVAGCDFGFFPSRAILVRPSGLRPYIHDCDFHDNRSGSDPNKNEAIALGYDNPTSGTSMRARVVGNKLWNLNVETEAICVKTSDNTIQGNQISSSKAGYSNRYGERNLFQSNTSTNAGGFLVEDRGQRLLGNTINGGGRIKVLAGNTTCATTTNGPHCQATNTYLEGNSGPLTVGYAYSGMTLPAIGTTVASHSGPISLANQSGTTLPGD